MVERLVMGLDEVDETWSALVGGKGAQLGELSRIDGIRAPAGFAVTTDAFRRIAAVPSIADRLDRLSRLEHDDRAAIGALAAQRRQAFEEVAVPDDLVAAITGAGARLGEGADYAVRSSATAGGPADGVLRGPARHVPQRPGAYRGAPPRRAVLGLAVHRAGRGLPPAPSMAGKLLLPGPDARIMPTTFDEWLIDQARG